MPVVRRLLADGETAVGVYRKLAGNRPGTFLLESAEQGKQWSRWSFVGVRCAGRADREGRPLPLAGGQPARPPGRPAGGACTRLSRRLRSPRDSDLPPLTGGLVGYLGYDVVRRLERLPSTAPDDLGMPELAMMLATDLAVLDHEDGSVLLIANVLAGGSYDEAVARLDAMAADLSTSSASTVAAFDTVVSPDVRGPSAQQYMDGVERVRGAHPGR